MTLETYNTRNMTTAHAIAIIELIKQANSFSFSDNYNDLKDLCYTILNFLKQNNLSETAFYEQLNKKIINFDDSITNPNIKKNIFEHMKSSVLDVHYDFISAKFKIKNSGF